MIKKPPDTVSLILLAALGLAAFGLVARPETPKSQAVECPAVPTCQTIAGATTFDIDHHEYVVGSGLGMNAITLPKGVPVTLQNDGKDLYHYDSEGAFKQAATTYETVTTHGGIVVNVVCVNGICTASATR